MGVWRREVGGIEMKIITLETLKTMPNGTVFSEIDKWGNLENGIRILTGRFENRAG